MKYLLYLSPTVRQCIDYDSQKFKEIYNQKTSVERAFSRLSEKAKKMQL